jgi:hypothetical protein
MGDGARDGVRLIRLRGVSDSSNSEGNEKTWYLCAICTVCGESLNRNSGDIYVNERTRFKLQLT